jgi:hypothetical protein
VELSNANTDPDSLLNALHAERETAAQEQKRRAEEEEDDAEVARHFAKIPTGPIDGVKGKGKAVTEANGDASDASNSDEENIGLPAALTVKRRPAPAAAGLGGRAEPTVAALLAERAQARNGAAEPVVASSSAPNPAQAKRKREGMQKLLGIKKKK